MKKEILAVAAAFVSEALFFCVLAVLILALLIPYVMHYYFLKNAGKRCIIKT